MSFQKGHIPWNKGKKGRQDWHNVDGLKRGWTKGKRHTQSTKKKISETLTGRPQPWNQGEKSNFWKGGKTEKMLVLKNSKEYRAWRKSVFDRDDYTCVDCGEKGGRLEADHIKPKSEFPHLIFEVENGRILCKSCHKKTDTYGIKQYNQRVCV